MRPVIIYAPDEEWMERAEALMRASRYFKELPEYNAHCKIGAKSGSADKYLNHAPVFGLTGGGRLAVHFRKPGELTITIDGESGDIELVLDILRISKHGYQKLCKEAP